MEIEKSWYIILHLLIIKFAWFDLFIIINFYRRYEFHNTIVQ